MTLFQLRVDSLKALTETLSSKGQHCFGAVGSNDVGKWAVQFYPNGDAKSGAGYCSIFVKNVVLAPGVAAVKIEGNVRIVSHDGQHKPPLPLPPHHLTQQHRHGSTSSFLSTGSAGINEGVLPPARSPIRATMAAALPSAAAAATGAGGAASGINGEEQEQQRQERQEEEEGDDVNPVPGIDADGAGGAAAATAATDAAAAGLAAISISTESEGGGTSGNGGGLHPPPVEGPATDEEEATTMDPAASPLDTSMDSASVPAAAAAAAAAVVAAASGGQEAGGSGGGGGSSIGVGRASSGGAAGETVLLMTKAFGKCAHFINPTADGVACSSSWGFHDFCPLSELPEAFIIEVEIQAKEVAKEDALSLHVHSLQDLKRQCPRGQSTLGSVHVDAEGGKWSLCLYPNGDNLSREGQLGVFVKVLSLPRGITAVKIEGNLRVLQQGRILASRSFPVSTFLNASGTGAASSSTWGFHDFCELREVGQQDAFVIEADITIRDRAREPSVQEAPEGYSLERLLECLRLAHAREVDDARNAHRTLTEAQLRGLTLDQLLEMQEHITNIIREKRSQENECAVCQDRVKAIAMVPCGHRFCTECSPNLATCPECRQQITQKIRLF